MEYEPRKLKRTEYPSTVVIGQLTNWGDASRARYMVAAALPTHGSIYGSLWPILSQ